MLSNSEHQEALRRLEMLSEKAQPPLGAARARAARSGDVRHHAAVRARQRRRRPRRARAASASTITLGVVARPRGRQADRDHARLVARRAPGVASLPARRRLARCSPASACSAGSASRCRCSSRRSRSAAPREALTSAKLGTLVASLIAGYRAGGLMLRFERAARANHDARRTPALLNELSAITRCSDSVSSSCGSARRGWRRWSRWGSARASCRCSSRAPRPGWWIAIGAVKLTLLGSAGLMAVGATLRRLGRRQDERLLPEA